MKKVIIFITFLILNCSIANQEKEYFKDNKVLSIKETGELLNLLHAFDRQVAKIEKTNVRDIAHTYESFFQRLRNQEAQGYINIGVNLEEQEKLESLLNNELLESMWYDTYSTRKDKYGFIDTTYDTRINHTSKLFEVLRQEVAPQDSMINEIFKSIDRVGDLTPTFFANILINYNKFDILDDRIRLMIAIHYLAINRGYLVERG